MTRLNNYIVKYLLFSFPLVVIMITWGAFQSQQEIMAINNGFINFILEILSLHLIFWLIVLIYALIAMLVSPDFRNRILIKLARIKDRDEREGYIIAQSSRFTFFSTLALLVFLLFFSTVNITLCKLPDEQAINGRNHSLSIGLSYDRFMNNTDALQNKNVIFSTQSLPLANQNILILIIIWHVGTFLYLSKKMQTGE